MEIQLTSRCHLIVKITSALLVNTWTTHIPKRQASHAVNVCHAQSVNLLNVCDKKSEYPARRRTCAAKLAIAVHQLATRFKETKAQRFQSSTIAQPMLTLAQKDTSSSLTGNHCKRKEESVVNARRSLPLLRHQQPHLLNVLRERTMRTSHTNASAKRATLSMQATYR